MDSSKERGINTPLPSTNSNNSPAPFAPFRLLLGVLGIVLILQGLIYLQGFFIALANLDSWQSSIMLRPVYIYALPAYYYFSRWLGHILPEKAFMLAILLAITSFFLVSYINYLYLDMPFAHTITDLYILITSITASIMGGIQGKKKAFNNSAAC